MRLYFAHFSPPSRTVLMTMRNLDLEVDIKHVDFRKKDNKTEEYSKLNPLQQVPVFVDEDGFVLTESLAISTFLVNSRSSESLLYPKDPMKRALVDQRLYYDATVVFKSHVDILVRNSLKAFRGSTR